MYMNSDNRRFKRVNFLGGSAVFVDYGCYYKGELTDISYDGFRVSFSSTSSQTIFWPDLSSFFTPTIWRLRKFKIIISINVDRSDADTVKSLSRATRSSIVLAYPRWMMKKNTQMEIGFKIPESSVGWQFFVHKKMVAEH